MAYTVAQLRRSTSPDSLYMNSIDNQFVTLQTQSPFSQKMFSDLAIQPGVNVTVNSNTTFNPTVFQQGVTYFINLQIKRVYPSNKYSEGSSQDTTNNILKISMCLRETETSADIPLNDIFEVKPNEANNNQFDNHSVVFTPKNNSYGFLVLKLSRIAYDELASEERKWLIENGNVIVNDCCSLNNICPEGQIPFLKMGFQARPGTLIVVNKSPIRVGRSGIYELNNDTKIYSIMIAAPGGSTASNIDAFLLDYAYDKK